MLAVTHTHPPQQYRRRVAFSGLGQALSLQEAKQRLVSFIDDRAFDAVGEGELSDFDVVFDRLTDTGLSTDLDNKLIIIHGATFDGINEALATVGGGLTAALPDAALATAISRSSHPLIVPGSLGIATQVLALVSGFINIIDNKIKTDPGGADTQVQVTPMASSATPPTSGSPSAATASPISRTQARAIAHGAVANPSARPISTGATIALAGIAVGLVVTVLIVKTLRR